MLSFAADENFNLHIVNGVLRRLPDVDIRRVQDAGLEAADDPAVLEWAASEGRILLTHDANTITAFAYERVAQNLPMPGVFEVPLRIPSALQLRKSFCWPSAVSQANGRGRSITCRSSNAQE